MTSLERQGSGRRSFRTIRPALAAGGSPVWITRVRGIGGASGSGHRGPCRGGSASSLRCEIQNHTNEPTKLLKTIEGTGETNQVTENRQFRCVIQPSY